MIFILCSAWRESTPVLWRDPGLARHVNAYGVYLARADDSPQGALDGRLADFCRFFLAACPDQVRFI
jgi:hypothetical protein